MSQLLLQSALYVQTNQLGCLGDPHDTPILPRVLLVCRSIFHSSLPPFYLRHDPAYETGLDDFALAQQNAANQAIVRIVPTHLAAYNMYQTNQIWNIDETKRARNLRGILQLVALSSTVQFTPRLTLLHPLVDFRTFDILFRRALFFPYFCRTVSRFESHFITDENAHMVGKMIGLKSLVINGENQDRCIPTPHRLTFAGLKSFRGLVELRELRLEKCRHIQTDMMQLHMALESQYRMDKTLEEGFGNMFGEEDDPDQRKSNNNYNEVQIPLLRDIIKDMRHLKILSLRGTETIVPESFAGICESNPGLQQIDLADTQMTGRQDATVPQKYDCWGFLRPILLRDRDGLKKLNLTCLNPELRVWVARNGLWSANWRNLWGLDDKDNSGNDIYDTQAIYDLRSFNGEYSFTAFRDLEPFQQCPYLEELRISTSDRTLADNTMPRNCTTIFEPLFNTNLKRLYLANRFNFDGSDKHMIELMRNIGAQLEELSLKDCMISNAVIKALVDSKRTSNSNDNISVADLTILELPGNPLLTSIILRWIGESDSISRSLQELDLDKCTELFSGSTQNNNENMDGDMGLAMLEGDDGNNNQRSAAATAEDPENAERDGAKDDDCEYLAKCKNLKKLNLMSTKVPELEINFLVRKGTFKQLEFFYR